MLWTLQWVILPNILRLCDDEPPRSNVIDLFGRWPKNHQRDHCQPACASRPLLYHTNLRGMSSSPIAAYRPLAERADHAIPPIAPDDLRRLQLGAQSDRARPVFLRRAAGRKCSVLRASRGHFPDVASGRAPDDENVGRRHPIQLQLSA